MHFECVQIAEFELYNTLAHATESNTRTIIIIVYILYILRVGVRDSRGRLQHTSIQFSYWALLATYI